MTAIRALLVCEGPTDERTVRDICWISLRDEGPDWVADQEPEYVFDLVNASGASGFVKSSRLRAELENAGVPARLFSRFGSGKGFAKVARKTALLTRQVKATIAANAVVLVADSDGHISRREELISAFETLTSELEVPVCVGVAHQMREAWLAANWTALDAAEASTLNLLAKDIGFRPDRHAYRLGCRRADDAHPKRALDRLCKGSNERADACISNSSATDLRCRSGGTGLPEFLNELQKLHSLL